MKHATPIHATALLLLAFTTLQAAEPMPPAGFRALFNGKDLSGWHGLNPHSVAKLEGEKREQNLKKQREEFASHWRVENGELVNVGTGPYATTDVELGDIELLIDYKTVPKADSGIYLRGTPQVQIWDPNKKPAAGVGSGGLYNNFIGAHDPLKRADKPVGEWNSFWIKMVGDKVWVKLNGELVVDGVVMENYWLRELEQARQKAEKSEGKGPSTRPVGPMFPTGQIELQHHRSPLAFKNIYIKELPR